MLWPDIARRQAGVVRRSQLLAVGLTRHQIARLLESRLLTATPHRGVYRAASAPDSPDSQAWLAVLGARAVLSYLSAAAWWDLPVEQDGRIHVTRHHRQRLLTHKRIRVHRTLLVPSAVTTWYGLDVTTRTETLLDCLGWLRLGAARTLLDRAFQQSWLGRPDIERRLDEQAGRWGNRQLARLLRDSRPGAEAESERRLQRLLDEAGIGGWKGNHPVVIAGRRLRLDVAFPEHRLDVEVDGWAFHRSKEARDRDIERDNLLTQAGWRVLRFSWEDVVDRPDYVIDVIASVLATRSAG
jgi:very-short-patch-repair endonuclease